MYYYDVYYDEYDWMDILDEGVYMHFFYPVV